MMFRVTKCGLLGFSFTVTIFDFEVFPVFASVTFANSALRIRTFWFRPRVRYSLSFSGPRNAYCCSTPISNFRFLRNGRYRPPVDFLRERPCHSAIDGPREAVRSGGRYKRFARPRQVAVAGRAYSLHENRHPKAANR